MLGTTLNHRYRLEQLLSRASSGPLYLVTDERSRVTAGRPTR